MRGATGESRAAALAHGRHVDGRNSARWTAGGSTATGCARRSGAIARQEKPEARGSTAHLVQQLARQGVKHADARVATGDGKEATAGVKADVVSRVWAQIHSHERGKGADLPHHSNTIGVARRQQVTVAGERGTVARVAVLLQDVRLQATARVPKADGVVCAGRREDVGLELKAGVVDRILVPAERLAAPHRVEIPDLDRVVHGRSGQEVARVVEVAAPDSVAVLGEGGGALAATNAGW